jgi:hypothetical protein
MRRVPLIACAAALLTALCGPAAGAGAASNAEAKAALARVEALFDGRVNGRIDDASIRMRDLAVALPGLSPADRARADRLLARPTQERDPRSGYGVPEEYTCSEHFCVHYVRETDDAPPLRDAGGNGVPDFVDTVVSVLEFLWGKEIGEFGFRPPPSDVALANHGPDGRFDVYLDEIVDEGVLGYCAPERPSGYEFWDVPGYCVLDNDYSPSQIGPPGLGGRIELELTAVHEFFHAIQFGYDFAEDVWFLEGTATWIEDAVYDNVNEPYRRFPYSPLRQPEVPIDAYSQTRPYQYGSWVFWRYLEELLARTTSRQDASVIRRVWEFADGRPGAPDLYSLEAVEATLGERGQAFRTAFQRFAVVNFLPSTFYREGLQWPHSPLSRTFVLTGRKPRATWSVRLNHLSSRYVAFTPGAGTARNARLVVDLDLPLTGTGATAAAIVVPRSGRPTVVTARLDFTGAGAIRVPFGRGRIARVVLVLTNASDRFTCWRPGSYFSCRGIPADEGLAYRFRARAGR